MNTPETPIAAEPAADTPFCKALRWRVHDPAEALHIAAAHRRRAAKARDAIPAAIGSFRDRCRANGLEQRACQHDELAAVCEQHAANLQATGGATT